MRTAGRFLWIRTIGSTIIGEGTDSAIFITLAFIGIIPNGGLIQSILSQWFIKVAYETVATPFTYLIVNALNAPSAKITSTMIQISIRLLLHKNALACGLIRFAKFLDAKRIDVASIHPPRLRKQVQALVSDGIWKRIQKHDRTFAHFVGAALDWRDRGLALIIIPFGWIIKKT